MKKSINDLHAQVERVERLTAERGGWKNCHPYCEPFNLHQMAASIAGRRGLSRFGDRDQKGEWRADMWKSLPEPPEPYKPIAAKPIPPKEHKELTEFEKQEYERLLNESVNEIEMVHVLQWVQKDILLHTMLGVPGDPLTIPKRLYAEMKRFIEGHEQGTLFS